MVAAFLESTETSNTGGPTLAERLSVVALAVRLRLNGSHAAPRWAQWYDVAHGLALMVLLYQGVAATVSVAVGIGIAARSPVDTRQWYEGVITWSRLGGLLWVAAFGCFVLRQTMAARLLALSAVAAAIAVTATIVATYGASPEPLGLGDLSRWGWLAVSAAVVFVAPRRATASPRLWFGAYLVGSVLVLLVSLRAFVPLIARYWQWARFGDLADISALALIVAIAIVLVRVWLGRPGSLNWLLALAIMAGGIGGMRLARWYNLTIPPFGQAAPASLSTMLDATLVGLAAVSVVAALTAKRWRLAEEALTGDR